MRDGDPECLLRLGDRVRWCFDGNEDESFVGTVSGLKRRFSQTPDLAIDSVEVWFDERVHLVEGMEGFKRQWTPAVHVKLLPREEGEG